MQKVPLMPTFPDTILAETADLTLEEKGALWDLLNHMWLQGGWLNDDDVRIARLLRLTQNRWQKLKITLSKWLKYHDGKFTYPRLLNDYAQAIERIERNKTNGRIGAQKRRDNKPTEPANVLATATANSVATLAAGLRQAYQ